MIAWLGYTILVTLLLSAAAFAAERAARALHAPTRWIWAATIVASLLLPTAISSISIELPNIFAPSSASHALVLRDATAVRVAAPQWIAKRTAPLVVAATGTSNIDPLIKRAWMAVSAAMLLALALSAVVLHVRKRSWPVRRIAGVEVYVTPDAGPAVVGLLRPRIVLPLWLTRASEGKQALVMAHEKSHLDAYDPQLLSVALCLLVIMPWNLPLWWQLRRLRHAIEVDCDARVLNAGHDLRSYGEALVDVGQRQSGYVGAVAAMAESRSFLEQRIRIMLQAPGRWSRAGALILSGMALCMVAAAAQLTPPNASTNNPLAIGPYVDASDRREVRVSPSRLLDYEGAYRLDESRMLTITRDGRRLWSQMSGRDKIELYPERSDYFFSRDVDMQVSFQRDDRGRVTGLLIHRYGYARPAPMLSPAEAATIAATFAERAHRSKPMPGGQAALWRNADALSTGVVHDDVLTPEFAQETRALLPGIQKSMQGINWGKALSIKFEKVVDDGSDLYLVEHEHAFVRWLIQVDSSGKIAEAIPVDFPKSSFSKSFFAEPPK